jgi:hypothetical protein
MQRRSAIGRLAATLTGLSLGSVSNLEAEVALGGEPFSATSGNLPQSSGTISCPICQEMADSLDFTPAGPCLRCADRNPALRAAPHSDPFWTLSHRELRRLESEIQRLAAELEGMGRRFLELQQRQLADGGGMYDRAMEAEGARWHALQRELHLLHLLRAASRQFSV